MAMVVGSFSGSRRLDRLILTPSMRSRGRAAKASPTRVRFAVFVGLKFGILVISEPKPRAERRHIEEKPSGTYEDAEIGIRTFVHHNRKSMNEYLTTDLMGRKKHIDFEDTRNGIGVASLGDKKYKAVEYSERFFHDGGLVAGSTHQIKIKTAGNAKAIDFYSGLKLDGPLNKDRVKWSDRVKKEERGRCAHYLTPTNKIIIICYCYRWRCWRCRIPQQLGENHLKRSRSQLRTLRRRECSSASSRGNPR